MGIFRKIKNWINDVRPWLFSERGKIAVHNHWDGHWTILSAVETKVSQMFLNNKRRGLEADAYLFEGDLDEKTIKKLGLELSGGDYEVPIEKYKEVSKLVRVRGMRSKLHEMYTCVKMIRNLHTAADKYGWDLSKEEYNKRMKEIYDYIIDHGDYWYD